MAPYQHMFCILDYRIVSYFTQVCIDIGVFDYLSERSYTISELAEQTKTHQGALYRCLRGLVHFELFQETKEATFSLTRASHYLTRKSKLSLRPWYTFCQIAQSTKHQKRRTMWEEMLRSGKSIYQLRHDQLFYDYLREHQDVAVAFDLGMESMSQVEICDIVAHIDFSSSKHITEIAGGNGALIKQVLKRYKTIQGQLCDFEDVVKRVSIDKQLTISAVNMHEALPEIPGDVMMKRVLHSYSDTAAQNILSNTFKAMQTGGLLYVFELVDGQEINPYVGIKNLQMLLAHGASGSNAGPGERTRNEFEVLLNSAGFELEQVKKLPTIDTIVARRK
mmetsp:Transcript_10535/g.24451  ORF Transcript_10535/g.24451 Transcript_10535/m.24451 type:complete len:335 (-) Transcript_10535:1587-2591(-)